MSEVQVQIRQAYHHVFAAKAAERLGREVVKGCDPRLAPYPVPLEPPFTPVGALLRASPGNEPDELPFSQSLPKSELVRLQAWVPAAHTIDWTRAERFLKQLQGVSQRVGFEIGGNRDGVTVGFLCHAADVELVAVAFREFDECALSTVQGGSLPFLQTDVGWPVSLLDYVPSPPYSHLLTQPGELHSSPYKTLILALGGLPRDSFGLCQVLFEHVDPRHDWHGNVEALLDLEFRVRQIQDIQSPGRNPQQAPSASLTQMSMDVSTKAHNDKPFLAVALRVALLGATDETRRRNLAAFIGLVQHGNRPLSVLTEADYGFLPEGGIQSLLLRGLTYRPGFLLNSRELCTLVHLVPPADVTRVKSDLLPALEVLCPTGLSATAPGEGTWIGDCHRGAEILPVWVPPDIRARHTHMIGGSGTGKSTLIEHMVLRDIAQGHGVAVIDPHGDLAQRILEMIPESETHRTIFLDAGDPDWVPLWNPLRPAPGQDLSKTADSLVGVFKDIVTGWGDRLERLLREAIYGVMHLPDPTLLDVAEMLRQNSSEGERLRARVLELIENVETRRFWENDFGNYTKADLFPPQHKIGKLLSGGTIGDMLSQPESRFTLRRAMDDGCILVADLSTLGSEVRNLLGSFLLSLFHMAALSRRDTPADQRKQFHVYCDEAHRFVTSAIEDLVAETRKYKVSLTLAHQYRTQFARERMDALTGTGSTIIFSVNKADAASLVRDLKGFASAEDLVGLGVGEAIVRVGSEVIRVRTPPPLPTGDGGQRRRIIADSHERFYARVGDVRRALSRRGDRWSVRFADLGVRGEVNGNGDGNEELAYDEFGK